HLAHDRDRKRIELAREVRADARPRIAAIVGSIHVLRRPVEAARRARADAVRRIPVRTIGRDRGPCRLLSLLGAAPTPAATAAARSTRLRRTDAAALVGPHVPAADVAVLRLAVDDHRVFRIAARLEPVTAVDDEPVARPHAPGARRTGRPAEGE